MVKRRIYLASSWRNKLQPAVLSQLRAWGHEVYDFRNPPGGTGFAWSQVQDGDKHWEEWSFAEYRQALEHPVSEAGFHSDFDAMAWADTCVLLLPSGRSAHLEAGHMAGSGKDAICYSPGATEPELMVKMLDGGITDSLDVVRAYLQEEISHGE